LTIALTFESFRQLRQCAAATCCSAYTADYSEGQPGPGMGPPGMGGGGGNDLCMYANDGECDEPEYCAFGTDGMDCMSGPPGGGMGGPPGMGGGDGETCEVDISGPGTFVGEFMPWSVQESELIGAQLLSKNSIDDSPGSSSGRETLSSGAGVPTTNVRMKKRVVFRGKFVPDSLSSALPKTSESHPKTKKSRQSTVSDLMSHNSVFLESSHHQFEQFQPLTHQKEHIGVLSKAEEWLSTAEDPSGLLPTPRVREATLGAPGAPGGKKARREAEMRAKKLNSDSKPHHQEPAALLSGHSRHLLSTNSTNRTSVDFLGFVTGVVFLDFYGHAFSNCDSGISDDDVLNAVKDWISGLLNADTYVINTGSENPGPFGRADISAAKKGAPSPPGPPPPQGQSPDPIWSDWNGCYDYQEVSLDIEVKVKDGAHRTQMVELLKSHLFSNPLATGSCAALGRDWDCGYFPGDASYTAQYSRWIEEPNANYCGDGTAQDELAEDCDEGTRIMSEYGSCHQCRCNDGFQIVPTGGCICTTPDEEVTIDAVESDSVQGGENNVTFSVQLTNAVTGVNSDGKMPEPVVVTISGLQGATMTSALGEVPIRCKHSLPTNWADANGNPECRLGLAPTVGTTDFRPGYAQWSASDGTLKFTVLGVLESGTDPKLRRFELSVTLFNAPSVQSERRPTASVCTAASSVSNYESLGLYASEKANGALSSTGYILGSTAKKLDASATVAQTLEFQKVLEGSTITVVKVTVPAGSMPYGSELIVFAREADLDKGLSPSMIARIPYMENGVAEAVLAGAGNTMLKLLLRDKTSRQPVAFLNDDVELQVGVNQAVLRSRGQCYTPESNTVTVCLPGYAGLYKLIETENQHEWDFVPDVLQAASDEGPAHASRMYSKLTSKVKRDMSSSTSYIALAVPPCNDYSGMGRAGGDLVCFAEPQETASAYASLGGGTISKMPSIPATSRPGKQARCGSYIPTFSRLLSLYHVFIHTWHVHVYV
jgi:hypothetical protein